MWYGFDADHQRQLAAIEENDETASPCAKSMNRTGVRAVTDEDHRP
jgi:hypothetical protein